MTDQNLLFSPDLDLNLLSKSSPSQLEPFQFKRSRTQPIPTEAFYSTQKTNNNSSKSSNLSHVPCKFFKQGTCTAGANCTFSHSSDLSSESAVCKYFVKGNCKFGTKCALLHTMSPYGATKNGNNNSNHNAGGRMMASTPPSLPFHRRKTTDQMMSFSPAGVDHRSFLHDPFASSAPAVSLLHLHEQQQQLWRNQSRTLGNDFMAIRSSSPRETQDPFLGSSPFSSRLSSSFSNNGGLIQSPNRYQNSTFGSIGQEDTSYFNQPNYDLNDAMLPSSLNDLFTPSELQVRRVRQQESYRSNAAETTTPSWSSRDVAQSSFDQQHHYQQQQQQQQPQWRVPFLTKSSQSALSTDYEDRLVEGTAAINIPGGKSASSAGSSSEYVQQDELQDDDVQFFMEDDEAVTYDMATADHKMADMTNSKVKSYNFPSLVNYSTNSSN